MVWNFGSFLCLPYRPCFTILQFLLSQMLREISRMQDELNQKISEIGSLQMEQRRDSRDSDNSVEKLKNLIHSLEEENRKIKVYFLPWFLNKIYAACFQLFLCVCVLYYVFIMFVYTFTSIFIQTLDLTNFSW